MPEPVGRNRHLDSSAKRGLAHDAENGKAAQRGAMAAGPEDGVIFTGGIAKLRQQGGDGRWQLDSSGLAAFAENSDLSAVAIGLHIPPAEPADFAYPNSGRVEQQEQSPISWIGLQAENAVDVGLGQDALGQPATQCGQPQGTANIEAQVANSVAEGKQRFHC